MGGNGSKPQQNQKHKGDVQQRPDTPRPGDRSSAEERQMEALLAAGSSQNQTTAKKRDSAWAGDDVAALFGSGASQKKTGVGTRSIGKSVQQPEDAHVFWGEQHSGFNVPGAPGPKV